MTDLSDLRGRLDDVDQRILDAIADRFEIIREIADAKADAGIAMMQPARVSFVRQRYADFGAARLLDPERFAAIADQLIAAACDLENAIIQRASPDRPR